MNVHISYQNDETGLKNDFGICPPKLSDILPVSFVSDMSQF